MQADINILYKSDFYKIIDFRCKCKGVCKSKPEFSRSFNISFIRKGNFTYKVFRDAFDSYTGCAIIDKPGSEHVVEHFHHIPDECTIIDFSDDFYETIKENYKIEHKLFFTNNDVQSLFIKTNAEVEYLHYQLLNQKFDYSINIEMDNLVLEILQWFLERIDNRPLQLKVDPKLKTNHLNTVEEAKEYMCKNFIEDISLTDISRNCNVSPFHFSRLFKKFTETSPYQYLLDVRLKNAYGLITNAHLSIKDICYQSGFNSAEHFNAAFRKKYGHAPSYFRKKPKR